MTARVMRCLFWPVHAPRCSLSCVFILLLLYLLLPVFCCLSFYIGGASCDPTTSHGFSCLSNQDPSSLSPRKRFKLIAKMFLLIRFICDCPTRKTADLPRSSLPLL